MKNELVLKNNPQVMGILNLTPDSFSDGGRFNTAEAAVKRAREMVLEGVDIIDIGAMSTRPGSEKITPDEEIKRLKGTLERIVKETNCPVSVDTVYPETARYALSCGASIINDVSGSFSREMAEVVSEYNAFWIVAHAPFFDAGASVEYPQGVVKDIQDFFSSVKDKCREFSIDYSKIILDPGFGFCKDKEQNIEILKNFSLFREFGAPLLCALSLKRFIGEIINEPQAEKRQDATLAANMLAIAKGANIIRVHKVKAHADALKLLLEIKT